MKAREEVLVLAPLWSDAEVICRVLSGAGIQCRPCDNVQEIRDRLNDGAGALLLTEEALGENNREGVLQALQSQPTWSDLPVTLLLSPVKASPRNPVALVDVFPGHNVTVLHRPVPSATLKSVMDAALRARRRQYQLREHLQQREEQAELLEQRVKARTKKLHDLASQLTRAEHEERHRIAQILHDDLQQQLYGLQIQLTFLREDAPQKALEDIDALEEMMSTAIKTVRDLSVDLSPPILHDEGLVQGIHWIAGRMRDRYRMEVKVQAEGAFPVPDDGQRVLVFQILRELLFNAVKHAGVECVRVTLRQAEDEYQIDVVDQGAGFDPQQILTSEGTRDGRGLVSAQQRLQLTGGRLEIESAPGQGTRATIYTPAPKAQ